MPKRQAKKASVESQNIRMVCQIYLGIGDGYFDSGSLINIRIIPEVIELNFLSLLAKGRNLKKNLTEKAKMKILQQIISP